MDLVYRYEWLWNCSRTYDSRAKYVAWKISEKPIIFTEYGCDTIAGLHDVDERTPFKKKINWNYYKMNEKMLIHYHIL